MADVNKHINYSLADIECYLQGRMNSKEMHDLERAALQDPFLADAIEGYIAADIPLSQKHLAEINSLLREDKQQTTVVALPQKVKKNTSWRIAASVILLAGIAGFSYFIFNKKANESALAKNESAAFTTLNDSAHTLMQQTIPASPSPDTIAFKNQNNEIAKNNSLPTGNKKQKDIPAEEQPTHQKMSAPSFLRRDKNTDSTNSAQDYAMAMPAPATTLSGSIIDNKQEPVANATITLADSTKAISDREGRFSLTTTTDSTATASVSAFGYKPVSGVQLSKQNNKVMLKEKPFALSDVEVTSIGKARKKVADTAAVMPEGGWQSFQEYVYKRLNKKFDSTMSSASINGELQLEFSIDEEGQPYNFTIVHAPDSRLANKAISAIRQGPKWVGAQKGKKARVTVKY